MSEEETPSVDDVAGVANNAAFVALAIAAVRVQEDWSIPVLIEDWVKTEAALGALNVEDANRGLTKPEEAERERIEAYFGKRLADALVKNGKAKGLRVAYDHEPRGPAIRVFWDGCPSNGFGGGVILPLP
jgi:hypothetical protein